MKTTIEKILTRFDANLKAVNGLVNFDEALLQLGIHSLTEVHKRLKEHKFDNPRYGLDKTINMLTNIKENESLKIQYSMMFNQCVVLQVSYFASTLKSMFTDCLMHAITADAPGKKLKNETIQVSLGELADFGFNLADHIGTLVSSKNDISFQDMQSINRAFSTYFDVELERTVDVDNIIFAQACRHCIVHTGAIADEKLLQQIKTAVNRTVKIDLVSGEMFSFDPKSIRATADSMQNYVKNLSQKLLKKASPEK